LDCAGFRCSRIEEIGRPEYHTAQVHPRLFTEGSHMAELAKDHTRGENVRTHSPGDESINYSSNNAALVAKCDVHPPAI
jgi:hypothetical protein